MPYRYHGEPKNLTDKCEGCQYHILSLPAELISRFPEGHYIYSNAGWCLWGSTVKRLEMLTVHHLHVCRCLNDRLPWNSISKEF